MLWTFLPFLDNVSILYVILFIQIHFHFITSLYSSFICWLEVNGTFHAVECLRIDTVMKSAYLASRSFRFTAVVYGIEGSLCCSLTVLVTVADVFFDNKRSTAVSLGQLETATFIDEL